MTRLLVDTGIWIDHLRRHDEALAGALVVGRVIGHPMVTGELAMGSLADRLAFLGLLRRLPQAVGATDAEVVELVERRTLHGAGLGFIDAHLLAATLLTPGTRLWTRDKRLDRIAQHLGIGVEMMP